MAAMRRQAAHAEGVGMPRVDAAQELTASVKATTTDYQCQGALKIGIGNTGEGEPPGGKIS